MKQALKRITSFTLAICIIVISVLLCPVNSYAVYDPGTSWWDKFVTETSTYLSYLACRVGAVVKDHDFYKWYQAREDYTEWWNTGHVSRNEDSEGNITFSFDADLMAQFKQALIEYSQETNGFYLLPTTDYRTVPAERFCNAPQYRTFKNIVEEKGAIIASLPYSTSSSFKFVAPFNNPDEPISLVGASDMVSKLKDTPWICVGTKIYGFNDWESKKYRWQIFPDINTVYHTTAVSIDYTVGGDNLNFAYDGLLINYDPSNHGSYGWDSPIIYSTTGEKMRVFVSVSAMKNYSVGTRTVYFGKDFYDYQPADITATWDEINDRIEHIDDILQQLLDKLGDADDEKTIEELLQEILDAINNGGSGGNGGSSGSNGGSSAPSGWFDSVLAYLESILQAIEALVWIEADDKLDGDKGDLFDLIDKIWKNPQEGSQEAADTLTSSFSEIASGITKKFPFSIPWDIHALFTVFTGTPAPSRAEYRTVTLGSSITPFTVDNEDLEQDVHEAPYFVLPLTVESYGISENLVIDLKDFKSVSTLSRGLLSALFGVFLIKFTIRIIELFKGGAD